MTNLTNATTINSCVEQYEDVLSNELTNLSLNNEAQSITYSPYDQLELNSTLDTTFGKDIYGRRITSIITDFLGYSSYNDACSRFRELIEKCNAIIKESNQNKSQDSKAVVILQTSCDENEAFSDTIFVPQLQHIAKTYYVAFRVIGYQGETLRESICKIAKELNGRSIMILIIRAHGNKDLILLGDKNYYTADDVSKEDFALLDPNASIIFDSCLVGHELAKKVTAVVQSMSVFACIDSYNKCFFTHCCKDHGYGLVAFNNAQKQISRVYSNNKGTITEKIPCCATSKRIKQIKQEQIHDIMSAAESGDPIYQVKLAFCYYSGRDIPKSYSIAVTWYHKAASQGNSMAQFYLGYFYQTGLGVKQSYKEAAEWYLKSANQGDSDAQNNLGILYHKGKGVSQSDKEALKWYKLSANQGNRCAKWNLFYLSVKADIRWPKIPNLKKAVLSSF